VLMPGFVLVHLWEKGCTTNQKRYDPIGFWENRHSSPFAFTRWLFVLKYVHKRYTMNCLLFPICFIHNTSKLKSSRNCICVEIWGIICIMTMKFITPRVDI
jgi:hypothetical protein